MPTVPLTALVTGANKGIGFATARQLGQQGFAVWLGCRSEERSKEAADALQLAGIDASLLLLDGTDAESVRTAAASLAEEIDALGVLVSNAGMHFGPPPPASEEVGRRRASDVRRERLRRGTRQYTKSYI